MAVTVKILNIFFPMFFVVLAGTVFSKKYRMEMEVINRINTSLLIPALVFSGLVANSYQTLDVLKLACGSLLLLVGGGLVGWWLAIAVHEDPKTLIPSLMFSNGGNLGLPLAILTFGNGVIPWIIILFTVASLAHFSLGVWLVNQGQGVYSVFKSPTLISALLAMACVQFHVDLWAPLLTTGRLLGDASIPLALLALGAKIGNEGLTSWRSGAMVAIVKPVSGVTLAMLILPVLGLTTEQENLFLL